MKKLTVKSAEEFARKIFNQLSSSEEKEYRILHAQLVGDIACILAKNRMFDNDLLRIAGWVHDIGRSVSEENHPIHSFKLLEKEYEISEKLKDCIINHSTSAEPKTEEGKLFQVADKSFFLNPELIVLLLKYNKKRIKKEDIKFIRWMAEKVVTVLETFDIE